MANIRETEEYKNMSFRDMTFLTWNEAESEEEQLAFWQMLVDTGLAWQLEGWYGRTAMDLINNGIIDVPLTE